MTSQIYSAKTNIEYLDENGSYVPAVGVGKDKKTALEMCLNEIANAFPNMQTISTEILQEINLPCKITFIKNNKELTSYYFKVHEKLISVLTDKNLFKFSLKNSVLDTLQEKISKTKDSDLNNISKEYLKDNGFYPTFDFLKNIT